MTRRRNRATWRLTDENMDWLEAERKRLAQDEGLDLPVNQVLNFLLFQWRKMQDPDFQACEITASTVPTAGYVYVLSDGTGLFKIGCSIRPENRRKELQTATPRTIHTVATIECAATEMQGLEQAIHSRFRDKHVRGEWFKLDVADVEWISLYGTRQGADA